VTDAFDDLDATGCADLVRRGEVSARELVDAAAARIERLPALNAVVRDRFDRARAEAAGALPDGPFRGVPLLLKDLGCHVAGEATDAGTSFLRDAGIRWPDSSYLAEQFRAAGFVVVGRSNVPEFGTTVTTEPPANGPTRNPYDLRRSAGGSSGGSAAAVAAGLVPVAHANDGGGSIRIPASACGLVGLKPTRGRVSQGPLVGEGWAGATIDGCVSRTVRDTAGVLDCIRAVFPGDPYFPPPPARPYTAEVGAPPGRLRVGVLAVPPVAGIPGAPEAREAAEAAGRLLAGLGHEVDEAFPAALAERAFAPHFLATVTADTARLLLQLERLLGRPIRDDELEPRNAAYRRMGAALSATDYLESRAWLGAWSRRTAGWWEPGDRGGAGYDVLVTPTVNGAAPELGWFTAAGPAEEGRRIAAFIPYTGAFNVTGQPAVSLPLHSTREGLPVGVQFVARYGAEDLLLRLAGQLEQAAPWAGRRPALWAGT